MTDSSLFPPGGGGEVGHSLRVSLQRADMGWKVTQPVGPGMTETEDPVWGCDICRAPGHAVSLASIPRPGAIFVITRPEGRSQGTNLGFQTREDLQGRWRLLWAQLCQKLPWKCQEADFGACSGQRLQSQIKNTESSELLHST